MLPSDHHIDEGPKYRSSSVIGCGNLWQLSIFQLKKEVMVSSVVA